MKIYKDIKCTEEVGNTLPLGSVSVGEEKIYEFYILNDTPYPYKNLEFTMGHPEIKVMESPTELVSKGKSRLIIKWTPSITLNEGFEAKIKVKGITEVPLNKVN